MGVNGRRPNRNDHPSAVGVLGDKKNDKPTWSYSSLHQITSICPRQFAFQRIEKLEPEFVSDNVIFGTAIHSAASWMWRLKREGQRAKPTELADVFEQTFRNGLAEAGRVKFDENDSADSLLSEGARLVHVLVKNDDPAELVIDVDKTFEVPITNTAGTQLPKPLVGEMDAIIVRSGEEKLVVRDLKTSSRRYSDSQVREALQPLIYLYGARQIYKETPCDEFEYAVLLKLKREPELLRYTTKREDAADKLYNLASTADRLISADALLPNRESFWCAGCGFKSACNEWLRHSARAISTP